MEMSYQEKSITGSLIAILLAYGYYFAAVLRHLGEPELVGSTLGRLILAVIVLVVIEIIYHIALSAAAKPEKDERDVIIGLKAYRNAYFAYGAGAFFVVACVIAAGLMRDSAATRIIATPFLLVNFVLLFMVLAELVKLVSQLRYYSRGVR